MSESRLSNALMQTLQGGQSTENEDAFDQEKLGVSTLEDIDDQPKIGEEELNFDTAPVELKKSDRISPKRNIKADRKSSGLALNALALVMSLGAIAVAGYAIYNQTTVSSLIEAEAKQFDASVGDLNQRTDNLILDFAQAEQGINQNRNSIANIEDLRSSMVLLQNSLFDVRTELTSIQSTQGQQSESIKENATQIASISSDVKKLKARPKPVAQSSIPRPTPTQTPVVVEIPNQIEGAVLGSIDVWGTEQYVMLREQSGSWYPLTAGDIYKSWRFNGLEGDTAIFKKDSKTKQLTIVE